MNELAVVGAFVRIKTLADGTPRVELDLDCSLSDAAAIFDAPGAPVAVARMSGEAAQRSAQANTAAPYGRHARALRQSAFFRTPEVWRAIGTDSHYLDWLRQRPCAVCGAQGSEAAHVRRVANGAGTGIKPEYSAIPLCRTHHQLQHQQGESAIGGRDWVDQQRIEHVQQWAWDRLKATLGHAHWNALPPEVLRGWAERHDLTRHLPEPYR